MIVFVPVHDAETEANLRVVSAITLPAGTVVLIGREAERSALLASLTSTPESSMRPLFAMGHGSPDRLHRDATSVALTVDDVPAIGPRSVFAYACHTASHLGREAGRHGINWWGYTGAISAPADHPRLVFVFARLFGFVIDTFPSASTMSQIRDALDHLARACQDAADEVDLMAASDESISVLEAYYALHHLWDRLRVWLAGAAEPMMHPSAAPPILLV